MASTINFLKLLADPTRLRLLLLLEEDELSVGRAPEDSRDGTVAHLESSGAIETRRSRRRSALGKECLLRPDCETGTQLRPAKVSELIRALARGRCRKRRAIAPRSSSPCASAGTRPANISTSSRENLGSYVPGRSWQALAHTLISLLPPLHRRRSRCGRRDAFAAPCQDRAQGHRR